MKSKAEIQARVKRVEEIISEYRDQARKAKSRELKSEAVEKVIDFTMELDCLKWVLCEEEMNLQEPEKAADIAA